MEATAVVPQPASSASRTVQVIVIVTLSVIGVLVVIFIIAVTISAWPNNNHITKDQKTETSVLNIVTYALQKPPQLYDPNRADKRLRKTLRGQTAVVPDDSKVSLDAIYNVFDQKKACKFSLQCFCRAYPEGTVAMYNDGGDKDISRIVDEQLAEATGTAIFYEYDKENLNVNWKREDSQKAFKWISRFHRNLSKLKRRWVLLLEDDVFVKRRLRSEPTGTVYGGRLRTAGNGVTMSEEFLLDDTFSQWIVGKRNQGCVQSDSCLSTVNRNERFGSSCCGGVIIDREFWMRHYDGPQVNRWIQEMYGFIYHHHNDLIMSALFLCWGGNVLPNPEYIEVYWNPVGWNKEQYAIVHNYKKYYESKKKQKKTIHSFQQARRLALSGRDDDHTDRRNERNPRSQGYVLLAFGKKYEEMARVTIESIRTFDRHRPIQVVTDARVDFSQYRDVLNTVYPLEEVIRVWGKGSTEFESKGTIPKLAVVSNISAFTECLMVDVDVVAVRELASLWHTCEKSGHPLAIAGQSDKNNRAPSDWHYAMIDEVSKRCGFAVPQINSGIVYFDRDRLSDFQSTVLAYWLHHHEYLIQSIFRGGLPDEIFFAIYMGKNGIRPMDFQQEAWQHIFQDRVSTGELNLPLRSKSGKHYYFCHFLAKQVDMMRLCTQRAKAYWDRTNNSTAHQIHREPPKHHT